MLRRTTTHHANAEMVCTQQSDYAPAKIVKVRTRQSDYAPDKSGKRA